MAGENYISGHDWWKWRGKSDALLVTQSREIDELRRQAERCEYEHDQQSRRLSEKITELCELMHELRESLIALGGGIDNLDQRIRGLERSINGRGGGDPQEIWPPKMRPVVIGGSVVGGGSAIAWILYAILEFGKSLHWW